MSAGAAAFGTSPTRLFSRPAIKQKAARIAPERLLLFGTGALHPVGLSSSALACPGAAWSESRCEFEKPAGVNHAGCVFRRLFLRKQEIYAYSRMKCSTTMRCCATYHALYLFPRMKAGASWQVRAVQLYLAPMGTHTATGSTCGASVAALPLLSL